MTATTIAALGDEVLDELAKGLPTRAAGRTVRAFLDDAPLLSEFWTPLVVFDDAAMQHNIDLFAAWTAARGLQLMPHGKTTMAPAIWQRQLDAGSTGITLATMGQVRVARSFGVPSVMLANAVVDPRSLAWLAHEIADPMFEFVCWADSTATVDAMEQGLRAAGASRPVDVLVELGGSGGRTGARSVADARAIAARVAGSDMLRLAGVAGYEGSLAHDRSPGSLDAVRRYLEAQLELHHGLQSLYDDGPVFVTAGGSAYFDIVAEVYARGVESEPDTRWTLRSGAYAVHDDGYYRTVSPLDEGLGPDAPAAGRLRTAMTGVARVVSRPEPSLALLDGGKRDFPFDEGLPVPRAAASDLGTPWSPLADATISAMNDQHSYLRTADPAVEIGSVVRLGLSHPCTTFDKWRYLPVVEHAGSDRVVDLVRTFF